MPVFFQEGHLQICLWRSCESGIFSQGDLNRQFMLIVGIGDNDKDGTVLCMASDEMSGGDADTCLGE